MFILNALSWQYLQALKPNDKECFYSIALCFVPTDREDIALAFQNGVDCVNNYDDNAEGCNYFAWFFHVIATSQLTTLSSVSR